MPAPEGPEVDAVFAALADPTRRRLLDELAAEGPLTATELARNYHGVAPGGGRAPGRPLDRWAADVGAARPGGRYGVVASRFQDASRWLADVDRRWDDRLSALERHLASPPD